MKYLTEIICLRIVTELEFRSDMLMTDRAQSPAAQQTCTVSLQQVPSAAS